MIYYAQQNEYAFIIAQLIDTKYIIRHNKMFLLTLNVPST